MQRFKKILLLHRGDEAPAAPVQRAAALARANGARVTVFAPVQGPPSPARLTLRNAQAPGDLVQQVVTHGLEQARSVADALRRQGVDADAAAASGTDFIEVVRQVMRGRHDLVMFTPDGDGLRQRLLGSLGRHLMRKCPCPVWAIKPQTGHYARILAAVDPDPGDGGSMELSHKILTLAMSLARSEGGELHLVHAWDMYGESLLRGRTSPDELERLLEQTRSSHQRQLDQLLEGVDLSHTLHQVHLLKGDAGPTIARASEQLRPELVVMGTVGRTGLGGLFIGNTAERVLDGVQCSVLAVKPDGFVTPVVAEPAAEMVSRGLDG